MKVMVAVRPPAGIVNADDFNWPGFCAVPVAYL